MKQDPHEALVLVEHARDCIYAAAKHFPEDTEAFDSLRNLAMPLVTAIGSIKRHREDRATDALIALSLKEPKT